MAARRLATASPIPKVSSVSAAVASHGVGGEVGGAQSLTPRSAGDDAELGVVWSSGRHDAISARRKI